jgi:hypothetical protein
LSRYQNCCKTSLVTLSMAIKQASSNTPGGGHLTLPPGAVWWTRGLAAGGAAVSRPSFLSNTQWHRIFSSNSRPVACASPVLPVPSSLNVTPASVQRSHRWPPPIHSPQR